MDSNPNSKPIITLSQNVAGANPYPNEKFQQLSTDQPAKEGNEHEQDLKEYVFLFYVLYFIGVVTFCLLIEPILNALLWLVTEVAWFVVSNALNGI